MDHSIELRAGPARVVIAPDVGGAIAAFDWNGTAILRPTRAEAQAMGLVREFACYPLVPFSNRIAEAMLHWDDAAFVLQRYRSEEPHAIHGNGWQRVWAVVDKDAGRALLELVHQPVGEHAREWPFAFRARQEFVLTNSVLTLRLHIVNTGDRTFPVGLGWHPYFPRTPDIELGFRAKGVWLTDPTCLPTRHTALPSQWDFGTPRTIGTTTVDNCFTGWDSPAVVRWPERGLAVELSADATCDHLVVFVPRDRDFIAVEPVTHMTDAFNRAAHGQPDTGTHLLAPGTRFSCTMRLCIVPIH